MSAVRTWIARFGARSVPTDPSGDLSCIELKIWLNLHGIISFESAYVEEVREKEDQEAMEVNGNAQPADAPKKKRVKQDEVPFNYFASSFDLRALKKLSKKPRCMQPSSSN